MTSSPKRPYRKVERARQEEETRRRITEAAVELHRTRGPARTTVTELAERAGVSRVTVYHHFPTDVDLLAACSRHWAARNPFPDPEPWSDVADPAERLSTGLAELYAWYEAKGDMLGNVFRDIGLVPALATVMENLWSTYVDSLVRTLAAGWPADGAAARDLETALRLSVSFETWHTLTASGLGSTRAADLAARLVTGAFGE